MIACSRTLKCDARQNADSWEENFAISKMGHRQIKEHLKVLFAPPDTPVKPAQKTEVRWLRSKVLVAILLQDLVDMIVANLTFALAGEGCRIGDVEMGGECQNDA